MKFKTSFTLILLASLLAALLGLVRVPSAHAQSNITVGTCDETTLDNAINQANSDNNSDIISFNCTGDIKLNSTLNITGSMTLDGNGYSVTLDGQNQVEILSVKSGVTFKLNALTIANGSSGFGGGLFNNFSTVSITNSTFANNAAPLQGGGLLNLGGTVSITNSTFANNSSVQGEGGGLFNNRGTVSITNSTFANNFISSGDGGGLFNEGGTVSITNSTFAKNIHNVTGGSGGGLFNALGGMVSITNSTFAYNSAVAGGGLANEGQGSSMSIGGSIVANNAGGNCSNFFGGSTSDQGYNLSNDSGCEFTGTGDLQFTDPKFDPNGLQNNGGPTQTIALQAASPAIDHIPAAICPATATDQRGVSRLPGEHCDIGAFEFPDTTAPTLQLPAPITVNATSSAGAVVSYPATATDDDGDALTPSCAPTSGSTFPIGTTTVNCNASEPGSNRASGNFTVMVKGAADQVSDLINTVNSMGLSSSLQNALDAKLQDVLTAINAGQTATACSELTDFIGFVQSHIGKGISSSQATTLINAATNIQAVLGC